MEQEDVAMRRIGLLLLLGALVAALTAWGPGVAWATGLSSSVGTLAGSGGDEDDDGDDDDDDEDEDDDDGEDDDDAVGGGDRAFCASAAPAPEPMRTTTRAVRVNRKRVAAVRVTGRANQDSTVTVKLRSKGKLLASKSVDLDAGRSKLVKVKLSRKAFARIKLRDRIQAKVLVTAQAPADPVAFGQCFIPRLLDFDFDASSGPLGENPTGAFIWESLPNRRDGQVTCLQVTGNRASLGGTITAANLPSIVGQWFAFTVVDNTPGAPDLISGATRLPAAPPANTPACGATGEPTSPVTGDIVVQDNVSAGTDDEDDDDDDDDGDDGDDGDDDD
jgi:hypothetical protein